MAITYTEKGYGLHEKIKAVGHWLIHSDGEWLSSDDAAVQAIIDNYSLDDARAARCDEVTVRTRHLFDQAIADNSRGELAAWPLLVSEATAYQTSTSVATPNLVLEAQARGCTVTELAQRVLANAAQYQALRAQIAGTSGRHRDAINALTDFSAIVGYDFSTGWPEL